MSGMSGIERNGALMGVRGPWPLLTTTVVQQRAVQQYSSTAVQQYSSTAVQHQQDSSTAALSHDTRRAVVGGLQIRVEGVMVSRASERPLNHPGVDLDDPMVPMPKDGANRDGQILPFYVKWWNLTVPMCTRLKFWTHRIVHIDPRVVHGPFRCSEKQHTSYTDLPCGKIGHHMGQNGALA